MFEWLNKFAWKQLEKDGHFVLDGYDFTIAVEEGFVLYGLIRCFKPKTILEIGTYIGISTRFLAQGIRDNKLGGKIYSVDINPMFYSMYEGDEWPEIYIIKDSSINVLSSNKITNIDMAFIDGDHSYDIVKKEIGLVENLSSKKCIIILHDILFYPELSRLWNELNYQNKFLIKNRTGVGIIFIEK